MKRRTFTAATLLGTAALSTSRAEVPLTLVVPFPAGDALDAAARAIAEAASRELDVPVVVENKPGASGFIAASAVAKRGSPTTFLLGTTAMMAITPYVRKAPYEPAEFAPVARIATIAAVIAVGKSFPARNWNEFVALARREPGKYSYASPGEGTSLHLLMEALQASVGIKLLHVVYKGMAPALQDFLGGQVDIYPEAAVIPYVKSGSARALAVVGEARLPELPVVPTVRELKVPYEQTGWLGVFAARGVPPALSARVSAALRNAVALPELRGKLPPGVQPAYLAGSALAGQIQSDQVRYRKLIADLQIKLD